jgi:hypothetical protein
VITPFRIDVPDADLDDLRARLRGTRWPEVESVDDWSQGTPLGYLRSLCDYWASGYDWRALEARVNRFPQYRTGYGFSDKPSSPGLGDRAHRGGVGFADGSRFLGRRGEARRFSASA